MEGVAPNIEAVLNAARASEPGSSIFVFTDSSPSNFDEDHFGQTEALVAEKNLKVFFIHDALSSLTKRSIYETKQLHMNKSHHKRQVFSTLYKELEIFSGGETVIVPRTEISDLAPFISFSAIQSNNVIFRRDVTRGDNAHYFLVDSYTSQILIFVNGANTNINVSNITTPQGRLVTLFYKILVY